MRTGRLGSVTFAMSVVLAACAGTAGPRSTPSEAGASPSPVSALPTTASAVPSGARAGTASPVPSATPVPAIVGEWKGRHDCAVVVAALKQYGFAEFVNSIVVDDGLIPGVTNPAKLADPKRPCQGAVSFIHYHFFRADGQFGSLDENRQQVDDGPWSIVDATTFRISDVPFGYRVDGDTLTLTPLNVTHDCVVGTWCEEIWKLMVSLPGTTWTRSG